QDARFNALRVWQKLQAHMGTRAVRANQHVAGGAGAILKPGGDPPLWRFLKGNKFLAEVNKWVEPFKENAPQSDPANGQFAIDPLLLVCLQFNFKQVVQLMVEEGHGSARPGRIGDQLLE